MADGVILKKGTGFDNRELTAMPLDVLDGETFLGSESNEVQMGNAKLNQPIVKKISVNETYNISPGYHGGEDRFYQEDVPVEEGPIVDPGAGGIALDLIGKVLTSDTIIMAVEDLRPELIKIGVPVGDVIGSYQGFPDEE